MPFHPTGSYSFACVRVHLHARSVRGDEGVGLVLPHDPIDITVLNSWAKWMFEMAYWLTIVVVFTALITGIVIDTFAGTFVCPFRRQCQVL